MNVKNNYPFMCSVVLPLCSGDSVEVLDLANHNDRGADRGADRVTGG